MNPTDFEVVHAGRTFPDGDPAEFFRDQLQRLLSQADTQGIVLLIAVESAGDRPVAQAVRKPGVLRPAA